MSARDRSVVSDMTAADLEAVLAIASASFAHPWRRPAFEEELARPIARCRVLRGGDSAEIEAYAIWWIVAGEQHLLSMATAPSARRRGHGRVLLEDMLEAARRQDVGETFLEARSDNTAALALYAALDFEQLDVRPGYYEDGKDAIVMVRRASGR